MNLGVFYAVCYLIVGHCKRITSLEQYLCYGGMGSRVGYSSLRHSAKSK